MHTLTVRSFFVDTRNTLKSDEQNSLASRNQDLRNRIRLTPSIHMHIILAHACI